MAQETGFITGQIPDVALPNVTGSGLACGTGNRLITGQIPYVALPNVTGSGLACGTGNRLHHWTDSLCGPPQCDREWASMWHGKQASSLDRFITGHGIPGQIPDVALPNVTGSGLACGTGNRRHHWTDSLCGPPQCDREWLA